jgi:hypothetical protein
MSHEFDSERRRFFGAAALTLAAAELRRSSLAEAHTGANPAPNPPPRKTAMNTNASLRPIKQVNAGVLSVGYAEAGPAEGPVVLLLHGWPYDIHSFVEVTPILATAGYRVIVPYIRGYGSTRLRASKHRRWHRTQPAAGSTAGFCAGGPGRRAALMQPPLLEGDDGT